MNEIMPHQQQPSQENDSSTLMRLVATAMDRPDFDAAKLRELLVVKKEWEADEARKAYVQAMARFKSHAPKIAKNKDVAHNGKFMYRHATLDNASGVIGEALAGVDISHKWETEQLEGGIIRVTCVLTHALGHTERTPLQASPDTSGAKNAIQAIGSTVTYLQRYTLLAATGMAVADSDDDARGGKSMTEGELADWQAAIDACESIEASDALWPKIAAATTAAGDVPAHETLKAAMVAKRKALKK